MKHVRIILTLTLVVLLSSLAVFFVEQFTTPYIEAYQEKQANLAKYEVLPALNDIAIPNLTPTTEYDFTETSIDELIIIDGVGYIYTASFQGYQSIITYMIGVDTNGVLTGYKTLSEGDTPGLGGEIDNPSFYPQFKGLSVADAEAGNIDGLSGATVTTGGLKSSLAKVMLFHKATFMGVKVETPEEKLLRLKTEITFADVVLTDISGDYDLPAEITKMEMANDGTADKAVVFTVEFNGYVDTVTLVIAFDLTTNNVLGMRVVSHSETPGYGAGIDEESYLAQFDGMLLDDAFNGNIDAIAGTSNAPITSGGVIDSMNIAAGFYQAEFLGIVAETIPQKIERLLGESYPTADTFTDVTAEYPVNSDIEELYQVSLGTDLLGYAYIVRAEGASIEEDTYIHYLLAFDTELNVVNFALIDSTETSVYYARFVDDENYDDQFIGLVAGDDIEIDAPAGATTGSETNIYIEQSVQEIMNYHNTNLAGRPAPVEADLADLQSAYPGAVSFVSIYADLEYNTNILNIYEAKDGSDATIGYVYYAKTTGFAGTIEFLWSFDTTGVTQGIEITLTNESWNMAESFADYNGTQGYFPDTPWLDQFVGPNIDSYVFDDIDAVSGVSNTTGNGVGTQPGMIGGLENVVTYHQTENVGGGN